MERAAAPSYAALLPDDATRGQPRIRRLFAPTTDVRTPDQLQRLLATIEALREESGENVSKLKAWLSAQQKGVQAWLHKHQPLHTRRLECTHTVLTILQLGAGDLGRALNALQLADDNSLLLILPQLCDAIVQQTTALSPEQRAVLRAFLLRYAATSQHAALHIYWYIRAAMPSTPRAAPDSPKPGRHRRNNSGGSSFGGGSFGGGGGGGGGSRGRRRRRDHAD